MDTVHSSSGMLFFSLIFFLVLCPAGLAIPEVNIGNTTLVGRDVPGLKQEFFGGEEQFFDR
jgi:acetylcholinesterase